MKQIDVYCRPNSINIKQTRIKREWMEQTWEKHAYKCFPVSLANTLGYEISAPVDISFIWDGISDTTPDHVKILSGEEYAYSGRSNATVSFITGFVIKSDNNTSFLHMPVPNMFNTSYQTFTTLISTSFLDQEFPSAIRITEPNKVITIKAGEPFATLIPISLFNICNVELNLKDFNFDEEWNSNNIERGKVASEIVNSGQWTNWYRDAVDHKGNIVGEHELKSIKLKINDYRIANV
jgi:hypothetical protein